MKLKRCTCTCNCTKTSFIKYKHPFSTVAVHFSDLMKIKIKTFANEHLPYMHSEHLNCGTTAIKLDKHEH